MSENTTPWNDSGARAAIRARRAGSFIDQHVSPLFFDRTKSGPAREYREVVSESQFWEESSLILGAVRLNNFTLTDWFPRAPGVFWSEYALRARENVWSGQSHIDAELGKYFSPEAKFDLIGEGGIGTIRLRPRRIDDEYCWFGTALKGMECHAGIPLVIPDTVLRREGVNWGDQVSLKGSIRFLQDAGLDETAAHVHHARPLIVFVDEMEGVKTRESHESIVITPVALFQSGDLNDDYHSDRTQYTFVHCEAGDDTELDAATEWIEKYATKYSGRIITNFDEQRPNLADAPLSYQRLVAKTYDRAVIEHFTGTMMVNRIDQIVQGDVVTTKIGDISMENNINVGGSAIINIDSVLENVTQTIGESSGLNQLQKSELDLLVASMKADLDKIKEDHAAEAEAVAEALKKAVANASKPEAERKQSILEVSAKGLKDAAELVKDIAPNLLTTAGLIAKFIMGL